MRIYKCHIILILLLGFVISFPALAQIHLAPENGANGISGPITNSFIIKWASVDSAASYEYIMSDNPLCFDGCPGDTRKQNVPDTTATEYNLQEGKMYYWITRIHFLNGDTGYWSGVPSSFLAKWTEEEKDEIIKVAPNPCINKEVILKIDWAINPKAKEISIELFSVYGIKVKEAVVQKESTRFQEVKLHLQSIKKGIYIARFVIDDNPNNPNNRITKKIMLQ